MLVQQLPQVAQQGQPQIIQQLIPQQTLQQQINQQVPIVQNSQQQVNQQIPPQVINNQ